MGFWKNNIELTGFTGLKGWLYGVFRACSRVLRDLFDIERIRKGTCRTVLGPGIRAWGNGTLILRRRRRRRLGQILWGQIGILLPLVFLFPLLTATIVVIIVIVIGEHNSVKSIIAIILDIVIIMEEANNLSLSGVCSRRGLPRYQGLKSGFTSVLSLCLSVCLPSEGPAASSGSCARILLVDSFRCLKPELPLEQPKVSGVRSELFRKDVRKTSAYHRGLKRL